MITIRIKITIGGERHRGTKAQRERRELTTDGHGWGESGEVKEGG